MKDEDFIERKEKVLLAALGKSWLWKASRLIIGIIPPVGALVMLVHCTLLSFGIRVRSGYSTARSSASLPESSSALPMASAGCIERSLHTEC